MGLIVVRLFFLIKGGYNMKIKISYCVKSGYTNAELFSAPIGKEYFVQASVEIDGHEIRAHSDSIQSRLTFEQAKELKEQAKKRLLSKISSIADAKNYESRMSEILSSEEVEL